MDSALKHILCFILIYKLSYVLPKSHHQLSLKSMQSGLSPSPNTANGTDYHSLINNVPSTDQMSFNGRAM